MTPVFCLNLHYELHLTWARAGLSPSFTLLHRSREADSCLCLGAVGLLLFRATSHFIDIPAGSVTDSVVENLPLDDPAPPTTHLVFHQTDESCQVSCQPCSSSSLARRQNHPLVPSGTGGTGGRARRGRERGLTLITPALLSAIALSFPSSISPIHQSPSREPVQHIPLPQARFIYII